MGFWDKLLGRGNAREGRQESERGTAEARVSELLEEGVQLASQASFEAAAERFNAALVLVPNHSLVLLNLASTYQDRGSREQRGANRPEVLAQYGRAAVDLFERALAGAPPLSAQARTQVLMRLGRLLRILGEYEKSREALLRVVRDAEAGEQAKDAARDELVATHARLLGLPQRQHSESEARRFNALWEEATSPIQDLLGGRAGTMGPLSEENARRLERARPLLQQALELVPDNWAAAWVLGVVERRLGNHPRGLECLTRAFELNPYNPNVGREASICAGLAGRMDEAVRFSEAASAVDPDDMGLLANLALNLLLAGRVAEALPRARMAVARAPNDPISRAVLSLIEQVSSGGMSLEEARQSVLSSG
ncbi:tetratricopeptide repeat protein [Hyalangium gracile]|uniref:tetratricopeptide repeat protein n=1 Tax=Hyalangium gracile TaxID=394092 RepID=UPI001CCD613D|nr:tetratricopeptide repeat protein [Hyalangium gracile]